MTAASVTADVPTSERRWRQLMQRLRLPDSIGEYDALCTAYAEKHRHYHTLSHIEQCLRLFDECRRLAARPDEIELAIWYHDAVYKPASRNNEQRSADRAAGFLGAAGADATVAARVHSLVMATAHAALAEEPDAQLLVDVDLSILGAGEADYATFEASVREEYRWVPGPLYRRERRRVLQSFLDRSPIFSTPVLRERFEALARANLAAAIERLG